jgi:hypothetical protein
MAIPLNTFEYYLTTQIGVTTYITRIHMALRQNLNLSDVLELLADADSGDDDLDDGGGFSAHVSRWLRFQ